MILNKNWSIEFDGVNNCTLTFQEEREINKKDGSKEVGIYKEEYFRPSIHSALKLYIDKRIEDSQDVQDCLERIERAYEDIKKLKFN